MAKPQTTLRLSPETRKMQEELAHKLGLSLTAIVEMGIRKLYEAEVHYEADPSLIRGSTMDYQPTRSRTIDKRPKSKTE